MSVPEFATDDADRLAFVAFVRERKNTIHQLLTANVGMTHFRQSEIIEGYKFFVDLDLTDDANMAALLYAIDDFNDSQNDQQTDIRIIIRSFNNWLKQDIVSKFLL